MTDVNYTNLKIFARLVKNGYVTEKQILGMGIGDLIRLPKITAAEIRGISAFQQAIKTGNILSFFIEETKEQPMMDEPEEAEDHET